MAFRLAANRMKLATKNVAPPSDGEVVNFPRHVRRIICGAWASDNARQYLLDQKTASMVRRVSIRDKLCMLLRELDLENLQRSYHLTISHPRSRKFSSYPRRWGGKCFLIKSRLVLCLVGRFCHVEATSPVVSDIETRARAISYVALFFLFAEQPKCAV